MGNHHVGRAMAVGAKVFWATNEDQIVSQQTALTILDIIAEDFIGSDAEFDDEANTDTPLTRLIAVAFDATPEELADLYGETDTDGELWYEGPYRKFSNRYKFC